MACQGGAAAAGCRPITITDPFGAAVGYTYDSAGQRLSVAYPACGTAHYSYDLAGRLAQVSSLCQDSASTAYAYDAASRLITATLANGLVSVRGYDDADRLLTLTHSQFGWTVGAYTYTVDAAGHRTGQSESLLPPQTPPGQLATTVYTYTYDALDRLTGAAYSSGESFTYTYDAVGNKLSDTTLAGTTVYTYDLANRLTNLSGGISYTWDDNGNLIDNGQGVTYTYDAANRLVATNGDVITMGYNGLGDRLRLQVQGQVSTYTLDLASGLTQVLIERTAALTTTYLYGVGRIQQQSSVRTDFFLADALGTVRQLADASGDVTLLRYYEPYGRPLSSAGPGFSRFDFTGEYKDPGGLLFLRARYYSPTRGRFIQRDSWAGDYHIPLSLNRWLYAQANPLNRIDPSGLFSKELVAKSFGYSDYQLFLHDEYSKPYQQRMWGWIATLLEAEPGDSVYTAYSVSDYQYLPIWRGYTHIGDDNWFIVGGELQDGCDTILIEHLPLQSVAHIFGPRTQYNRFTLLKQAGGASQFLNGTDDGMVDLPDFVYAGVSVGGDISGGRAGIIVDRFGNRYATIDVWAGPSFPPVSLDGVQDIYRREVRRYIAPPFRKQSYIRHCLKPAVWLRTA